MKREESISNLLRLFQLKIFKMLVDEAAGKQEQNYSLQLLSSTLSHTGDPGHNWFTALAVMCIYQRTRSGRLINQAIVHSGNKPLGSFATKKLILEIITSAKLTKADAGRGAAQAA